MVSQLTYWVTISVLLHNLSAYASSLLATALHRQQAASRMGRLVSHWRIERALPGLHEAGRFFFYVGVPYLALVLGGVNPKMMGLHGTPVHTSTLPSFLTLLAGVLALDWARTLGSGSLLAASAFAALALMWWYYQRIVIKIPARSWRFRAPAGSNDLPSTGRWPLSASMAVLQEPWGWARLLLRAVYLETHWAFYRAWTLDLLREDPAGLTMGVLLGLVPVCLEWYGDVGLRGRLRTLIGVEEWVFVASLAVVSTFGFLFIGNLWGLIVIHWLLTWGLLSFLRWLRRQSGTSATATHTREI